MSRKRDNIQIRIGGGGGGSKMQSTTVFFFFFKIFEKIEDGV